LSAKQLKATPIRIERFGEKLAVWRDTNGRPVVFLDHCPHRCAPLSLGYIQSDELVCPYHGWRFNRDGECIEKPFEEQGAALKDRHAVKSYPAEDRAGYIWMFYGHREAVTPLHVPPELEDKTWSKFKTEYIWETNWLNVLDNVLDPLHPIYLHTSAPSERQRRDKFKGFRITDENDDGFCLGKSGYLQDGSIGPLKTEVEFQFPNIARLDLANGTLYRVIIMPTPYNAERVGAFYIRTRRVAGWARLKWWWLWWTCFRRANQLVTAQDRDVMVALGPIDEARSTENLAVSDIGVVHLRRRLSQRYAKAQKG
jgi:phenylpropionate dioxygenase-like ring-hydroxylating dioxygenase large terminal subunit